MHVVIVYLPGAQEMWQAPIFFKESHGDLGYPYFRKHIYIYVYGFLKAGEAAGQCSQQEVIPSQLGGF